MFEFAKVFIAAVAFASCCAAAAPDAEHIVLFSSQGVVVETPPWALTRREYPLLFSPNQRIAGKYCGCVVCSLHVSCVPPLSLSLQRKQHRQHAVNLATIAVSRRCFCFVVCICVLYVGIPRNLDRHWSG